MATTQSPTRLEIERTLNASVEDVFNAWTDAAALPQWFCPSNDYRPLDFAADPRPGGAYRMGMEHIETGKKHIVGGVYQTVEKPNKLVFSWKWEEEGAQESLVTLTLKPDGDKTLMRVVHENFENQESRDAHQQGWTGCLDRLQAHFA